MSLKKVDISRLLRSNLARQAVQTYWNVQPRTVVPPSNDPLLNASAVKLSEKIRNGEITSVNLTKRMIERIKETQPLINAATEIFEGDALECARQVDEYLAKLDKSSSEFGALAVNKPLLGVPFTLKNSFELKGKRVYCGLYYRASEEPSDLESEVSVKLRKAGSFPMAYTNVPPAVMAWESDNALFGRSSTPYDVRCTCGGSSGGEGALIAAQGSVIGMGSDIAGSIRMPALLNGIFGLKPFSYAVSSVGHWPSAPAGEVFELTGLGPLCRYAEDVPVMFKAIMEYDAPKDWETRKPTKLIACRGLDTAYCTDLSAYQLDAWTSALDFLSKAYGLQAQTYQMPPSKQLVEMYQNTLFQQDGHQGFTDLLLGSENSTIETEMIKALFGMSSSRLSALMLAHQLALPIPNQDTKRISDDKDRLIEEFFKMVDKDTVLVFPAFPQTHYYHSEPVPATWDTFYTAVFNLLGAPAMIVPVGLDAQGYPKCVQLVTARDNDLLLTNVAKDLAKEFGGWTPPKV